MPVVFHTPQLDFRALAERLARACRVAGDSIVYVRKNPSDANGESMLDCALEIAGEALQEAASAGVPVRGYDQEKGMWNE